MCYHHDKGTNFAQFDHRLDSDNEDEDGKDENIFNFDHNVGGVIVAQVAASCT